jgi:hypothetical protein
MICILKMTSAEIDGWIIATDIDDARRQAQGTWNNDLAATLYRMTFIPTAGKHAIPGGYIMLVS